MPVSSSVRKRRARDTSVIKTFRQRYEDRCVICGWCSGPCDVHHIRPLKDGGPDTIVNLVYLCPSCHRLAGRGVINQARLRHARTNMIRRAAVPKEYWDAVHGKF